MRSLRVGWVEEAGEFIDISPASEKHLGIVNTMEPNDELYERILSRRYPQVMGASSRTLPHREGCWVCFPRRSVYSCAGRHLFNSWRTPSHVVHFIRRWKRIQPRIEAAISSKLGWVRPTNYEFWGRVMGPPYTDCYISNVDYCKLFTDLSIVPFSS